MTPLRRAFVRASARTRVAFRVFAQTLRSVPPSAGPEKERELCAAFDTACRVAYEGPDGLADLREIYDASAEEPENPLHLFRPMRSAPGRASVREFLLAMTAPPTRDEKAESLAGPNNEGLTQ